MDHLERNRETFEPYVEDDESFDAYLDRMREDAEWGGNQELVAAGQLYNVRREEARDNTEVLALMLPRRGRLTAA